MPPHSLLSAGSNAQGQLATGDTEDAYSFIPCSFLGCEAGTLPPGTTRILNIACGANHTLLLLERSNVPENSSHRKIELWGSGDGSRGQLGPNITTSTRIFQSLDFDLDELGFGGYTITQVATCWETSYIVLSSAGHDDILLSMGTNDYGDLGIGGAKATVKKSRYGIYVVDLLWDGLFPSYPDARITVKSLATGPHHVLASLSASKSNGEIIEDLVGWGSSRHGQLGEWVDPEKGRPSPFLSSPHRILLDREDHAILQVAAGTHHTVILHGTGRLSALGSNRKGQLTTVDEQKDVASIGCTWHGTYAVILRDGTWTVASVGNHTKGQLGRQVHRVPTHDHAMANVQLPFSHDTHKLGKMACGSEHILALVINTTCQPSQTQVWGWGWNEHGNLGLGHTEDQKIPVKVWSSSNITGQPTPQITGIWAGCGTSWILLDS
ncbi:RCC1/BLIP-II [Irpex rosettiformis]|uniref:RCC1/BLIP-II n=1 Tax=Irpex rosettiformis TaxID=378272 RepID=A0ACB8UL96_9APHY|nr:RCC1/BLIP-II [Irpex rosettiformis]